MTNTEIKDFHWWERYFAVGGDWERRGGREQTRIFAQHFLARAELPRDASFSLLDVGCALGDALALIAQEFPEAQLHGLDFSATAIARAREALGTRAQLAVGEIDTMSGFFDAIYCSNTLEHFADFARKARRLIGHCRRLFVMVPFRELRDGKPIEADPTEHHQHTFDRRSFDFLVDEGLASRVSSSVFACPGAWGWSRREHIVQFGKNLARVALGRRWIEAPLQILYTIDAVRAPN